MARRWHWLAAGAGALALFGASCAKSDPAPSGEGGACATILDCTEGLDCVAQGADKRVCARITRPPAADAATDGPATDGPAVDGAPPADAIGPVPDVVEEPFPDVGAPDAGDPLDGSDGG